MSVLMRLLQVLCPWRRMPPNQLVEQVRREQEETEVRLRTLEIMADRRGEGGGR